MEALVSQDFEFNVLSKAYAEFLIECSNGYPEGRVERAPLYLNKDSNTIYVCFESPEPVAVFLKLKFGAHLRKRPAPSPVMDESIMKELRRLAGMKSLYKESYNEYNDYEDKKKYFKLDFLKSRKKISEDYYFDFTNGKFDNEE